MLAREAMRSRLAVALLVVVGAATACGYAALPKPPYTRHPSSALVEVPYPPPPARVEFIPDKPRDGAVWIDGEWTWQGRRWSWKHGRWVMPPSGVAFAPWRSIRNGDGTLFVAEGTWRDAKGNEVQAPPVLALGKATQGDVVNPEGENESTGQNVQPEGVDAGAGSEPDHGAIDGGAGGGTPP